MSAVPHRFRVSPGLLLCGLALLCLSCPCTAQAADPNEPLSIEEFNRIVAKRKGRMTVEGRWALMGKNQIKFKNCSTPFRSELPIPVLVHKSPTLEVSGELTEENGRKLFLISTVRELPTDMIRFLQIRQKIRGENPADWYQLGDWAESRGRFYDDPELLEKSTESRARGFQIERRQLPDNDPPARFALATKAETLGIPVELRAELIHEGYHLRRLQVAAAKAGGQELAADLARAYPESGVPLVPFPGELRKQYLNRPLPTYVAADAATRKQLHRVLWMEVELQLLQGQAAADGGNGFEIAELIDQRLPEFHALAEQYRDRALALRAEKVARLSRTEVVDLQREYKERKQDEQAAAVVESWLTLRRKALLPDDTEGLLELAEDYSRLLGRSDKESRVLLEAYEKYRGVTAVATGIATRLQHLGFEQRDGRWLTADEIQKLPTSQLEQALREGRVENGMTGAQVLKSLGTPLTSTRMVSAGQVVEIWTYGQANSSRLVVYLSKRSAPDSKVVGIDQIGTK